MIGFAREPERQRQVVRTGQYEYVAVRRARFFRLRIQNDDVLLALFLSIFGLSFLFGVFCGIH